MTVSGLEYRARLEAVTASRGFALEKEGQMRRLMLAVLFAMVLATPLSALAQDGTPAATTGGDAVTIYGSDAQPVGTISVDEVVDPFEDYDSGSQPTRGYRWVMATVTITAGERPLAPNSSGFLAVDSEGFSAYQSYVYRSSDDAALVPDLTSEEIPAGESRTGAIFFAIFVGSELVSIEYGASSDQSMVVYQPAGARVASGDVISVAANDGSPMVDVKVEGVIDPMEDYDPSSPPQRGFTYSAIVVTIVNTGDRVFQASPYLFSVVDYEGFVTSSSGVYRTSEGTAAIPDLGYVDVQPGGAITGLVSFQLVSGAKIGAVLFQPTYDRRIRIAEYEVGQPYPGVDVAVLPTAVPADPACVGVQEWSDQITILTDGIDDPIELVEAQDMAAGTVDVEALRSNADALRGLAAQISDIDTPEAAVAAQEQFLGVLLGMAVDMEKMADAFEAGDQAAFDAAKADVTTLLMGMVSSGPFMELSEKCPEVS